MPVVTPEELRDAHHRYLAAFAVYEQAQADRVAAIREALDEGWSHARIAEVLGVSRGRISQFVVTK